jgi:hypothetical protein
MWTKPSLLSATRTLLPAVHTATIFASVTGSARTLTLSTHVPGLLADGSAVAVPAISAIMAVALTATSAPTTPMVRRCRRIVDRGFMFSGPPSS